MLPPNHGLAIACSDHQPFHRTLCEHTNPSPVGCSGTRTGRYVTGLGLFEMCLPLRWFASDKLKSGILKLTSKHEDFKAEAQLESTEHNHPS